MQRPSSLTALTAALILFCGASSGCARLMGYTDAGKGEPIRQYPDGADGLKELFTDVLTAAQKDDRERVHDLLASTFMSDADLAALFGPLAPSLTLRYHGLMGTLVNPGAIELVAQVYERKLDAVEVLRIDPAAADATPDDHAVAKALITPLQLYSVRIRKSADTRGLRYDFFFYRDGKWLTGNQLGKLLPHPAPPPVPAPAKKK